MAIVVQEEKTEYTQPTGLIVWGLIIVLVIAGVYYIFFKRPDLADFAIPAEFEQARQISELQLSPQDVIDNPQFQALEVHVIEPLTASSGRVNPFLPPLEF